MPDTWMRFVLAKLLWPMIRPAIGPRRWRSAGRPGARAHGRIRVTRSFLWMVSTYGEEVLEDALHYFEHVEDALGRTCRIMTAAVQAVGKEALPLVLLLVQERQSQHPEGACPT